MLLKDLVSSICIQIDKDTDMVTHERIKLACLSIRDKILLSLHTKGIILTSFQQTLSVELEPYSEKVGMFISTTTLPFMLENSRTIFTLQPGNKTMLSTSYTMLTNNSSLPTNSVPKYSIKQNYLYSNYSGKVDIFGIFYNLAGSIACNLDSMEIDDIVANDIMVQIVQLEQNISQSDKQVELNKQSYYATK